MNVRERLRIGDLRLVLTESLKLPAFIKLKLTFKLPTMPLPVSFPKGIMNQLLLYIIVQRMYRVRKQLEQISKCREVLSTGSSSPENQSNHAKKSRKTTV